MLSFDWQSTSAIESPSHLTVPRRSIRLFVVLVADGLWYSALPGTGNEMI